MSLLFYVLVIVPFVWWLFYLILYLLWFVSNNFFIKYRYFLNDIFEVAMLFEKKIFHFHVLTFDRYISTVQKNSKIYKKKKNKFAEISKATTIWELLLCNAFKNKYHFFNYWNKIISSITGQLFLSWLLSVSFSFRFKCYIWKMNAMFEHSIEMPLVLFVLFLEFF